MTKFRRSIILILGAVVLLGAGCSLQERIKHAEPYTTMNKAAGVTTALATLFDGITTERNINGLDPGALETGFAAEMLIGEKPSIGSIALFNGSIIVLKSIIGHFLSQKNRNILWFGTAVPSAVQAYKNNKWYKEHRR